MYSNRDFSADWRVKVRSSDVEECYDQLILCVLLFLACHCCREKRAKSLNRWSRRERHGCVRQVHLCGLLRLLRHGSGADERTFCVTLVREDPSCPNRSEALLFHGCVLTRSVHVHLSYVLDLNLHCFLVHVIVIGHFCKTRFFHCSSRFKHLQTANSSQCLPQSTYHRQDTALGNVAPTDQLGEIVVYVFTIREKRSPPVDTRHQNRFHRTKLCIQRQISRVLMYKETTLRNLPTVDVSHPPHVCRPGTKSTPTSNNQIGLSRCKCDHIFARWAGSSKFHPVRKSNANLRVRPSLWTKHVFQDMKTLLPRELLNAHLTATSPSSQLLSPCNLWKQFCDGKNLCLVLSCIGKLRSAYRWRR